MSAGVSAQASSRAFALFQANQETYGLAYAWGEPL